MNTNRFTKAMVLAVMALLLACFSSRAQTILTNSYTNSFPNGGNTTNFTGGSAASWLYWYGLSFNNTQIQVDPTNDAGGDPTSGSLYLSMPFTASDQNVQIFGTFDNQYGYDGNSVIPLNIITNISFDIYVDPSTTPDANGNFGSVNMSLVDAGWSSGGRTAPWNTFMTIPGAAAGHWVHMQDTNVAAKCLAMEQLGYTQVAGVGFYFNSYGDNGYPNVTQNMWIDNVAVSTLTAPPPPPGPPTLSPPIASKPGLNVFNSTEGNTFYDRQEVELVNNHGLSWVGNTGSGPVSYSFTLSGFPTGSVYSGEAYLFLVPNPAALEGAPDYNETNCAVLEIQSTPAGGQAIFQYKTNTPNSENYTTVTNVQSTELLGTWTLEFTSDTNATMIAPNGSNVSFTIPEGVASLFAESSSFNLYLGGQANSATYINQAVVYSNFSVTGVSGAYSETFDGETNLNSSVWNNGYSSGPAGVLIVPTNAPYWVSWSTPAIGYSLLDSVNILTPSSAWNNVTSFPSINMYNVVKQLISKNDLGGGNSEYFKVVKREAYQLQVLLPGETAAPGTATGKTGTPMDQSTSAPFQFTVNAVDQNWNPVLGVYDSISITSSDSFFVPPASAKLTNGTGTFFGQFGQTGSWTITASDTTATNILSNTSSSVNVPN